MTQQFLMTSTANKQLAFEVSGYRKFRTRVLAWTNGAVTIAQRASSADTLIYARMLPTNLHVTSAAVNGAATVSLTAGGPGLFHYVTHINCMRATTTVVAGSAVLNITTTNLPGLPAWTVGNAIAVGGTLTDVNYTPTTPLKSILPNTTSTLVLPAYGAGVTGRGNVSYYLGA